MTIQQLAELMGVSEQDCANFVEQLKIWTNKGYSVEEAIKKNLQQWARLANAVR